MIVKRIVTVLLLLFVAASVIALALRRPDGGESPESAAGREAEGQAEAGEPAAESGASGADVQSGDMIIAYYFHGNARCKTCLRIEMYAREALGTGFAEEIGSGRIEFLPVNIELPENEHFIDDFRLSARTVVLERIIGGERKDYVNLTRVWELVGDKEAYFSYIQEETGKFLDGEK
jgi:hypothetical protein